MSPHAGHAGVTESARAAQPRSPRGYPLAPTGGEDGRPMTASEAQVFYERLVDIVADIGLDMGQGRLIVDRDKCSVGGRFYFQVEVTRPDIVTGEMGTGRGGKAYLSPSQTLSELVQCAFGLWIGYWSHEARETFLYRGRRVYGPHGDVESQWQIAETLDARGPRPTADPVGSLIDSLGAEADRFNAEAWQIQSSGTPDDSASSADGLMMAARACVDAVSIIKTEVDPVCVLDARAASMRDQVDAGALGEDETRVADIFAVAAKDLRRALTEDGSQQ